MTIARGAKLTRAAAAFERWRSAQRASGRRPYLLATLATAVLLLAACSRTEPTEKFQASDVTGATWGRDFRLTDFNGNARSLADYRGKVVMLFFGYTHCPDECPTTLNKMAQAIDRLGRDGSRVQGLFVTIDPVRDTPAVLRDYLHAFHPSFVGLTADAATIAATTKDFKVVDELEKPDAHGDYSVDHSSGIFVFDGEGRLRLFMGPRIWIDAMVHDLRLLLAAPTTPGRE